MPNKWVQIDRDKFESEIQKVLKAMSDKAINVASRASVADMKKIWIFWADEHMDWLNKISGNLDVTVGDIEDQVWNHERGTPCRVERMKMKNSKRKPRPSKKKKSP